jgi:hypothetical protein
MLIIYYHIIHNDDARYHDLPIVFWSQKYSTSLHNGIVGLQHPKYLLHIFPNNNLHYGIVNFLITLGCFGLASQNVSH